MLKNIINDIYIYIYIYQRNLWKGGCLLTNKTISLMEGGY